MPNRRTATFSKRFIPRGWHNLKWQSTGKIKASGTQQNDPILGCKLLQKSHGGFYGGLEKKVRLLVFKVGALNPSTPWESKSHWKFNGLSEKTVVLVGIYFHQQFQGTIMLIYFNGRLDFQGSKKIKATKNGTNDDSNSQNSGIVQKKKTRSSYLQDPVSRR